MAAVSVKRSIKDAKLSRFSSDLLMSLRSRKYIVGIHPEQLLSLSIGLPASLKSIFYLQFCEIAFVLNSLAELSEHLKCTS